VLNRRGVRQASTGHQGLAFAGGNGERHFIFSRLEQRRAGQRPNFPIGQRGKMQKEEG
jgi:hypothetical protein